MLLQLYRINSNAYYDHDNYVMHCVIACVALKIGLWVYKSLVIVSENYSILVKMELIHYLFPILLDSLLGTAARESGN